MRALLGRWCARRLMKALKLNVEVKRKYKGTINSKHPLPVAENVLDRQFSTQVPNQTGVWKSRICRHRKAGFA